MEGLKLIPYIALVLCISGIVIGASVITLAKFKDTIADKCFTGANSSWVLNAAGDGCFLSSDANASSADSGNRNLSGEYYSILKSIEGESTIAEQQPTVAIIAVMVIIISIIAGVFAYMRFFA